MWVLCGGSCSNGDPDLFHWTELEALKNAWTDVSRILNSVIESRRTADTENQKPAVILMAASEQGLMGASVPPCMMGNRRLQQTLADREVTAQKMVMGAAWKQSRAPYLWPTSGRVNPFSETCPSGTLEDRPLILAPI